MISAKELSRRRGFASDLNIATNDLPSWHEGDLLVKTDALLAGSARKVGPLYPVRLLVFAEHASHANEETFDPWQLVAVDRPACFVVADVCRAGNTTQYTLVEVNKDDLEDPTSLQLDEQAHASVKRVFESASATPAPDYVRDPVFMHAVGTDRVVGANDHLHRASTDEAQRYLKEHSADAPAAKKPAAAEPPSPKEEMSAPTQPEAIGTSIAHQAYQESDDSWIVALAESILSESAARSYMAADERAVQAAPDTASDAPQAAAAASALYETLHEDTPQPESSTPEKATQSQQPEIQAENAATALYETLHLAEAHLDETPDYTDIPTAAGLEFFQANNRCLAAHPALEYAESQRNFTRLLNRNLGGALISRLYAGDATPATEAERANEARRLWFDPLSQVDAFPLLSCDIESYLEGMHAQYQRFDTQNEGYSLSLDAARTQLERIDAALHGDIDSCRSLIEADHDALRLPYRFTFSVSFDVEQRQALINLFLPQKAVFPLAMQADTGDMGDAEFSASGFNLRYQGVACALGLAAMYLVKMNAAWVVEIALNAWYRTEDDPKCVYSLRVNERELAARATHNTQRAFQALKDMQAHIHSGNHHELLGLDPLFNLHDALDYHFGFKTYSNGWTFPPVFTAITGEATPENLDKTIRMLLDLIAQGQNDQAYEVARTHEKTYRQAWLEPLGQGTQALSCETALEEDVALRLPANQARCVLPRKLGQLYHILGTLANDAGKTDVARQWLQQAIRLNPVGALSFVELGKIELECDNEEAAREFLDAAREVAATPYALAQTAKYRGLAFARAGHAHAAYELISYAAHLHESETHLRTCLACIAQLDLDGAEGAKPHIAPLDECLTYLHEHGCQGGLSDVLWATVAPPVEAALAGGTLPDASYVDAYLCALHAHGRDIEQARSLVLNVHTVRMGDFPFSDYLFKPILLCDNDIVYTIDHTLGLAPNTPGANVALVAVPYIDPHAGLTFQVLGTADMDTRAPVNVLATPVKISASPYRDTPFRLLRPRDYPAFPIAATADQLSRVYAPSQEVDATRARRDIDILRDFGNPDNVLVVLAAPHTRPEGVWATLVRADAHGVLYARIANEPFDDFGVHAGDVRPLQLQTDPETGLVLAWVR